MRGARIAALLVLSLLGACSIVRIGEELPTELPPLVDLEEPVALLDEPDDELARRALPLGGFTGVVVADARASLDALVGEPEGLVVESLVENSPGRAAGLEPGDLLLEASVSGKDPQALAWPSDWRALELAAEPGASLVVRYDRAGREREATIVVEERLDPPAREGAARLREEQRVGIVLRQATEVEAREAGLAPGAGAVVVGLSARSPWRAAGVRYEDLLVSVDGEPVAHPEVVLQAIRAAPEDGRLELAVVRGGERISLEAPLSERESEVREIHVPLIYRYQNEDGRRSWSAVIGLFRYERTPAAWNLRLFWILRFEGGEADRLEELDA